jgi:hypothetical protein
MNATIAEAPASRHAQGEQADVAALEAAAPGSSRSAASEPECLFRFFTLAGLRRAIRPTLARVVRDVVVPELARRPRPRVLPPRPGSAVDAALVDRLTPLLIGSDSAAARDFIARLNADGVSLDSILLALMRRAERVLEGWFDEDRCSSLDVTLGVCQLRMLALELTRGEHRGRLASAPVQHRACVLSVAGDTLRFAPVLHECYLQMAGWDIQKVEGVEPDSVEAAGREVRDTAPELALFVLNERRHRDETAALIRRIRAVAGGVPPLCIGAGRGFAADAEQPEAVGLDAIVVDPEQTLIAAGGCIH